MKIAFILPALINKGPVIVAYNTIKYLKDKVDLIDVYYFDDHERLLNFDCNIYHINKSEIIDFDKYDIIHSHTLRSDLYVYKWRKKIHRAKIITTIHQDTFSMFTIRYNYVLSFFLTHYWLYVQRRFDGIVSISNQLKNRFNSLLSDKVTTIYNGCSIGPSRVDKEIQNKIENYRKDGYKILASYASITKGKGLSQILNVLNLLPDYAYMIIGEGPYVAELKKLTVKLNISNRVFFIPYIDAPYSYLKFIDVYMMPSYSEGFGLAMVEAALEKKSIVCSNIPSFQEIFQPNEVCFFELDNLESLVKSIKTAYEEKEMRGELAYIKANGFFTADKMADNHLLYYKEIIKKIS
jgi:glycogen synthase